VSARVVHVRKTRECFIDHVKGEREAERIHARPIDGAGIAEASSARLPVSTDKAAVPEDEFLAEVD
jgi:hypothetical protein